MTPLMHDAPRHAGRGAATPIEEINEVNTDPTADGTVFDGAPDWAENTDTKMAAIMGLDADPRLPHAPRKRRVRTAIHRTARFVGLVPPRHGCRRGSRPVQMVDPDATVDFHVVAPAWAERRHPYQGVAR